MMTDTASITLATLNARYIHSAFGLRYLKANMGELQAQTRLQEFTLESKAEDVVEQILANSPAIVGFGVYIWNAVQTEAVIRLLKAVQPDVVIVVGGPEVSYETETQSIFEVVDYVITGWGDISMPQLCRQLLDAQPPAEKIITGEQPKLDRITMPYDLYDQQDIDHRVLYVEASRGCPYKCEFCLSALDKTAWPFATDAFLEAMQDLYERGARQFKFVDRTFNLNTKVSLRILEFFLERMDERMFLHFELIPDHLPEALKEAIARFPAGSLQFEIGIQTFNQQTQQRISRRQNNAKALDNLRWLRESTLAHIHADLIFGLPGESIEQFAESFDKLYALQPHEIQVGILKRLKGSPIIRHTEPYQLRFNPNPPFNIVSNSEVSFVDMQRMNRLARYWDMLANSGRFQQTLPLLIDASPFQRFMQISEAIFARLQQTHKIALPRLFDVMHAIGNEQLGIDTQVLDDALLADFHRTGLKSIPRCLAGKTGSAVVSLAANKHNKRQRRHQ